MRIRNYFEEGKRAYKRLGMLAPNPYLTGQPRADFERGKDAAHRETKEGRNEHEQGAMLFGTRTTTGAQ
ncbi:hypothetical protein [Burkholderia gladioli]|uniref:hypothetical protein n=1 Tax=Burkholderia gladioli TaxID=28095 RepID=UPI00163E1E0B|nr:hypothetical protein [Burkholderia gladioli]